VQVIKAGAIADAALFELCELNADAILGSAVEAHMDFDEKSGVFLWPEGSVAARPEVSQLL
jgi:hypothetical protein